MYDNSIKSQSDLVFEGRGAGPRSRTGAPKGSLTPGLLEWDLKRDLNRDLNRT
jgi:hypothetical protein